MPEFDDLPHEERMAAIGRLASAALERYDLPDGASATLINVSENATYRVEAPASGKRWALRVHREHYHRRSGIASELAWLTALRRDGAVVTPVPVAGRDGELIQLVSHPDLPRPRHVVLSGWETGEEPNEDSDDLRGPFEILGAITARMHRHVRTWEKPAGFERFTWDFETTLGRRPHWGSWRDGMGLTPEIEDLFARSVDCIGERLERFGRSAERFNLVHCDMRLANLLIDGETTKVIDFDDCGFGYLMYDCATTVSFFEHRPEVPELIAAWVRGYRRVAELPEEDEAEIPTFVMLRRLLLVAWIGSHSETDLAQSQGVQYTRDTVGLCERYLADFGRRRETARSAMRAKDIPSAVRAICLSLPEAEERSGKRMPDYLVRGKVFALLAVNHHGDGYTALWLPAPPGAQQLHSEMAPEHYFVPPYVGPRGWLGVHLDRGNDWLAIESRVREAYSQVAPPELAGGMAPPLDIEAPTGTLDPEDFDPLLAPHAQAFLSRIRDFCDALPETTEGAQFGKPAFRAGKKTFLSVHRGERRLRLQLWVGPELQATLSEDPRFTIPMYIGHRGWIDLDVEDRVDWNEVRELVLGSYRHFALKRMLKVLDAGPA